MFNITGDRMTIPMQPDEDGYTGRECPECKAYFKIVFGTGLKGTTDCICPYCGHKGDHSQFYTQDQIDYAMSVARNYMVSELQKVFKNAFKPKHSSRKGLISIEFKVKTGRLPPIQFYQEAKLETQVECKQCTLKYAVFGVYAYCPDCGIHNSQQILEMNLELAQKELDLAATVDAELAEYLTNDALENVISAFDGFGREICRMYADKTASPAQAADIRFQNLTGAQSNVQKHFGFDIAGSLSPSEWSAAIRGFQKRHLLAHNSGVIDDDYIVKSNDATAIKGHKIAIISSEVTDLIVIVRAMGAHITSEMSKLP
jgi:hypothetical protein